MSTGFLHAMSLAYTHSQDNVSISGQLLMLDDKTPDTATFTEGDPILHHYRPPTLTFTNVMQCSCRFERKDNPESLYYVQ